MGYAGIGLENDNDDFEDLVTIFQDASCFDAFNVLATWCGDCYLEDMEV